MRAWKSGKRKSGKRKSGNRNIISQEDDRFRISQMRGKSVRILKASMESLREACRLVKKGGLVVYPTDTVYGLGCDPFNEEAVRRIFETKGRARKPLPILAFSIKHVNRVARLNERARKLVERFWPGSLTLVLEKKESLPSIVTCGFDRVGVRVPAHEVALTLIKLSGGLLVGTSANKSGSKPPRTAKEAANQVGDKVDLILDGGPTPLGVSSTVVDVTSEKIRVIREGPVSVKDVNQVLGF